VPGSPLWAISNPQTMKVIIYNRKSTRDKEDQQVLSIQGQKDENHKRIQREGHTIVREFDEEWTAKKPGRPKFAEMLKMIEQGKADAIVCWKLNRLARNPIDGGRIQWALQQGIIKAIITSEKIYVPSDNVIQMSVEFGMATQYSIDLSKDVKRGMLQKAKMGWRPGRATVGYMNDYAGVKGEKVILRDLERFDLVKQCWELLLAKAYSVPRILEIATTDLGLTMRVGRKKEPSPIGLSSLYQIFTNPFYYGEYEWDGQVYQGSHEPMISREQFELAQSILGAKGKPRQRKYLNAYPGLIRCGECNALIVVNMIEKHIKSTNEYKRYRYYRCAHNRPHVPCHQNKAMSEELLEEEFMRKIDAVDIPQSFIEWALVKLKCSQEDRMTQNKSTLISHQGNYKKVIEKIDSLVDRQLSVETRIPEELFNPKLTSLNVEKQRLNNLVQDFDASTSQWTEDIVNELNFTLYLRKRFTDGGREKKLEILHRLGQTIQLTDGVLDFRLKQTFTALAHGKLDMQKALGAIQPISDLEKPLLKVDSRTFKKVELVWSGLLEIITTVMGGSRSLCP